MEDLSKVKFNGEKLFKIRKKKRMSQETLAERVGVTRQTIYSWESNQRLPDVEKVGRLCKVLNINLSDLVDGIIEQENSADVTIEQKDITKKKKSQRLFFRIVLTLIAILIIVYIAISTIKFIMLNKIVNKFESLNNLSSYYIITKKIEQMDKNNLNSMRTNFREMYYNNNILKTIIKDANNKKIENIIINDYNSKIKYIINEKDKTYIKATIANTQNGTKFTDNFDMYFGYSNNLFLRYIFCMNPKVRILYNESYEFEIKNTVKMYIDKDNGLPVYIETFNKDFLETKQYYEYELNTGKDFEINLDDYTEVTE